MRITKQYSAIVKNTAMELRRQGRSYGEILNELKECGIPKNTLTCWCNKAKISLTPEQRDEINKRTHIMQMKHLRAIQLKGGAWHTQERKKRLEHAEFDAQYFLKQHNRTAKTDLFFLLGLYLGEGAKDDFRVMFANGNPNIIHTYLTLLRKVFPLDEKRLRVQLLLRYDQNTQKMAEYWSQLTNIPLSQFQKSHADVRTKNTVSFDSYKGVCAICYSDAKIQRFLLALQRQYIASVVKR